ncbi:MAG: lipid-A-disaccharide synthase [Chlamydiota bacterium]
MNDIFILAGEHSGDILGAELIKAWQGPHFYGVGGPRMQNAGLDTLIDLEELQVMGFGEIIKALPKILKVFKKVRDAILETSPAMVVLIDYQDFNLRLSRSLRKHGYQGKIVQYVSPTVWAWRKGRVDFMARYYDLVLCIFPFEPSYYAGTSLSAKYIGHPVANAISKKNYTPSWKGTLGMDATSNLLGIFPGSRRSEIVSNLPQQLAAAAEYRGKHPKFEVGISVADAKYRNIIDEIAQQSPLTSYRLISSDAYYDFMNSCDLAIATSGTVNLELALHNTPTVVTYQAGTLNYLLAKYIFKINLPYYSQPNIICGKEIFPEVVDRQVHASQIIAKLADVEPNPRQEVKKQLGNTEASQEATKILKELLDG